MNKITTDIISTTGINIQKYDILPAKVFINNIEITDVNSWNKVINSIDEKQEEIDRLNNIINELEKDLEEFDFTAYICGNRKASKSIELGARLNNAFILDKLKALKENNK